MFTCGQLSFAAPNTAAAIHTAALTNTARTVSFLASTSRQYVTGAAHLRQSDQRMQHHTMGLGMLQVCDVDVYSNHTSYHPAGKGSRSGWRCPPRPPPHMTFRVKTPAATASVSHTMRARSALFPLARRPPYMPAAWVHQFLVVGVCNAARCSRSVVKGSRQLVRSIWRLAAAHPVP